MIGPRFFLGCAAYRTIEPVTASSREELLGAMLVAGSLGLGEFVSAECVGSAISAGYGCCPNLERLTLAAREREADVLVFHDSDMSFTPGDVRSLLSTWAQYGPRCLVGSMYPEATDGGRMVGALVGVPNECGVFTRSAPDAPWLLNPKAVAEAEFLGLGLAAIPMAFFDGRPQPWWRESWDGQVHLGPDVWISKALLAEGWRVLADFGSQPRHLSREWRAM